MSDTSIHSYDALIQAIAPLQPSQRLVRLLAFLSQPEPLPAVDVIRAATDVVGLTQNSGERMAEAEARYQRGVAVVSLIEANDTITLPTGATRDTAVDDLRSAWNIWDRWLNEALDDAQARWVRAMRVRDKTKAAPLREDVAATADFRQRCGRAVAAALALGRAHVLRHAPAEALRWRKKALAMCDHLAGESAARLRATALVAIGLTFSEIGDSAAALDHLRRAIASASDGADSATAAEAYAALAAAYLAIGEAGAALQYYTDACDRYDAAIRAQESEGAVDPLRYHRISVVVGLAHARLMRGEHDSALELALSALGAYEELRQHPGGHAAMAVLGGLRANIVRVRLLIGAVQAARGQFDVALEQYGLAYELAGDADALLLPIMLEAGRVHRALGQIEETIDTYTNALELATATGHRPMKAQFLVELATCHAQAGDYREAYEQHVRYAKLREELADERGRAAAEIARVQFDTEQKAGEAERLQHRNAELEAELADMIVDIGLIDGHDRAAARAGRGRQGEQHGIDRRWTYFERRINDLYPGFLPALAQAAPELTKREMQVCALIRLGLEAPRILKAFGFVQRTLDTHRTHIRAKLGCDSSHDLLVCMMAVAARR